MPLKLRRRIQAAYGRERYQSLTFILCVLFGFALIANTQLASDGGWLSYASFWHGGKRLYADMHLNLQPLFVLQTAWCMKSLGNSWLASRVLGAIFVVAYIFGLLLVVRQSNLPDGQKAIVLACAFFLTANQIGYRLDDYHIPSDTYVMYALVLLLALGRAASTRRVLALAAGLGVLCALSITTRVNDGAALALGVAISILCMAQLRRIASLALFGVATALTIALVVRLTGDTFHDYAMTSIFHAAGSKGGTGSVLLNPIELPWITLRWLNDFVRGRPRYPRLVVYFFAVVAVWVFMLQPYLRTRQRRDLGIAIGGLALLLLPLHHVYQSLLDESVLIALTAFGAFAVYALGILAFLRFLRWELWPARAAAWDRRQILLLVPLGMLASAAMSAAGSHNGNYAPIAVMILLVPLVSPVAVRKGWVKSYLVAGAFLLACYCAVNKAVHPYTWHSYESRPFFVGRQWYRHPDYGPMIIDSQLLNFIAPVCRTIEAGGSEGELLSLPYPYANYFCDIPPWHGYVQTFFDTSSEATIDGLMDELRSAPPKWILYQRQLNNLAHHEQIFNHGKPLPHRYLDQLIMAKIATGEWQVVYTSTYGSRDYYTDEWILLRTRP